MRFYVTRLHVHFLPRFRSICGGPSHSNPLGLIAMDGARYASDSRNWLMILGFTHTAQLPFQN